MTKPLMGETSWVAFFCLPFSKNGVSGNGLFVIGRVKGNCPWQKEVCMEQSTNEIMYNLATALILDLLVNNKITQAEFERIDELNKESFGVG
nr:MAG TPA: hypothetical protein [Caudoviricetes sp.]